MGGNTAAVAILETDCDGLRVQLRVEVSRGVLRSLLEVGEGGELAADSAHQGHLVAMALPEALQRARDQFVQSLARACGELHMRASNERLEDAGILRAARESGQSGVSMECKQIRRHNLTVLLADYPSQKAFAEAVHTDPAFISQIVTRRREIGDDFARQIELKLEKPLGWMDVIKVDSADGR